MQKIFILFLSLTVTLSYASNGKKTPSKIESVTVYLNGAQIQRSAASSIFSGTTELIFNDLSPDINKNSIQISGLKDASILSINYSIDYLEKKKNSLEVKKLKEQLELLLAKKNKHDNLLLGLAHELKVLENNQQINSKETQLSLDRVQQISTYYRTRTTEINDKRFSINKSIKWINKEVSNLHKELRKVQGDAKTQRGQIKLKIDAPRAANLSLLITYNIRNAGWYPLYDIKAIDTQKPLNITYKANVYQQTGSDWKDVKIVLSTGDPSTNNSKPILNPRYLNFVYNKPENKRLQQAKSAQFKAEVAKMKMKEDSLEEEIAAADLAPRVYNNTVTEKQEGITNTSFQITKKYTINSNEEVTIIEIDNFEMLADYEHYAAPELNEDVFLTAKLGNWEQYNLLPGEANMYFEGSYAGKTQIDPQATTENLLVSLGVDPGIVVKRKQLDNFKSKSFIGTTKIVDRGYEITIKNNKSVAIKLVLEDRIPVTQNKEIKIEDFKIGNAKYNTKKGILQWDLEIPSKGSEKKQFSYRVKYPKNQRINF